MTNDLLQKIRNVALGTLGVVSLVVVGYIAHNSYDAGQKRAKATDQFKEIARKHGTELFSKSYSFVPTNQDNKHQYDPTLLETRARTITAFSKRYNIDVGTVQYMFDSINGITQKEDKLNMDASGVLKLPNDSVYKHLLQEYSKHSKIRQN
jgi:hypothetical protein